MRAIAKYASVAALAVASVTSANAATYIMDFSGTDNSNTIGTPGNARTTTTSNGSTSVSVRATGWSTNNNGASSIASYLGAYSAGYGVRNSLPDSHTVDNYGFVDFIVLQFSRSVTLTSAIFNAFSIPGQGAADTDAFVGAYKSPIAWTSSFGDPNAFFSGVQGTFESNVTSNSAAPRDISPPYYGNTWIIAASPTNADGKFDSFKIGQLGIAAVPEPATWAMMILGFGMVGGALRSRRAKATKVSYAF